MSTGIFSPAVKNIDKIIILLEKQYPDALETSLGHIDAFQLLVATILAAQSTDKLVNKVTPGLFRKYKTIHDFADADPEELEHDIRTTGFFRPMDVTDSSVRVSELFCGPATEAVQRHR